MTGHKEKVLYKEAYKGMFIKIGKLPTMKHLTEGFYVLEARILNAGVVELDGAKREFQDVRVYLGSSDQ
jgi:hypothetical protein